LVSAADEASSAGFWAHFNIVTYLLTYLHSFNKLLDNNISYSVVRLLLLCCGIKLYLSYSALTTTLGKGQFYRHICLHDISVIFY